MSNTQVIFLLGGNQEISADFVEKVKALFCSMRNGNVLQKKDADKTLQKMFYEGMSNLPTKRKNLKKSTIDRLNIMLNQRAKFLGTIPETDPWYMACLESSCDLQIRILETKEVVELKKNQELEVMA